MKTTLVLLVLVLASAQLSISQDKSKTPDFMTDYTAYTVSALRQHFPNVPLITQDRKAVRFYDDLIKGKTVIIQFMFANCEELCPLTTPNLVKVQGELEKRGIRDVSIISITIDPVHDTPAVLKEYASHMGVRPGWQFVTGKKADIDLIRRQLGVYDPDADKYAHMNVLTIGKEPKGQWMAMVALAKPDSIMDRVRRLAGP